MFQIVLLRHGESLWNQENRFTGWEDVPLSKKGIQEAKSAGERLKKNGFRFNFAYTSLLQRANDTLELALGSMDIDKDTIPVIKAWQFNERHYGALQGLNKAETIKKFGEEQVHIWRRSYDTRPPALDATEERALAQNQKFSQLKPSRIPLTESLKDTVDRVVAFWNDEVTNQILMGRKVIIVAHGNSLRALIKHIDEISDEKISELNIPTGTPLVYEFNIRLHPTKHYYL